MNQFRLDVDTVVVADATQVFTDPDGQPPRAAAPVEQSRGAGELGVPLQEGDVADGGGHEVGVLAEVRAAHAQGQRGERYAVLLRDADSAGREGRGVGRGLGHAPECTPVTRPARPVPA